MKFSKRKMMAIAAASMVALAPMTAKADIRDSPTFQLAQSEFSSFERKYGARLAPWLYENGNMEEIEKFFREPDNLDLCEMSRQGDVRGWRLQCFEKWGDSRKRKAKSKRPKVSKQRNFELISEFVRRFKLLVEETGNAVRRAEIESQKLIDKEREEADKAIAEAQKEEPLTLEYVSKKLGEASKPIVDIIEEERRKGEIVVTDEEKPVEREKLDRVKLLHEKALEANERVVLARENLDRLTGEVAQIKKAQEEALARKRTAVAKAEQQLNVKGILAAEREYTKVEIKRIRSELDLKLAEINEGKAKAELEQKILNLAVELRPLYAELRKNPIPHWLFVDNRRDLKDKFCSNFGSTLFAIPLEGGGYSFGYCGPQEQLDVLTEKPEECLYYNEAAFFKFVELVLRV